MRINILSVFFMLFGPFSMSFASADAQPGTLSSSEFAIETTGRDIRWISVHPNGQEWLVAECSRELLPSGDCYVLKYNLLTKQLQRFDLPTGYLYSWPRYSPGGNYVLIGRSPSHDGSPEKMRLSAENSEIVVMNSDGKDFQILPLAAGSKLGPFMSKDEKSVAFWRSMVFRPGNPRLMTSGFTVWEFNLKTGKETLFGSDEPFLHGGNADYISDNEILVGPYAPKRFVQSLNEYFAANNSSEVYRLRRGDTMIPPASFTEVHLAPDPSLDSSGNVYVQGVHKNLGSCLVRIKPTGETEYWQVLRDIGVNPLRQVLASPSGKYIAVIYIAKGAHYSENKSALGIFDIETTSWHSVGLPSLTAAKIINVVQKSYSKDHG